MNDIFLAIENNDLQTLKDLISQKIDINSQNDKGDTPLMAAIRAKNSDMVKLLVENNADINKRNNTGATALIFAVFYKNLEILKLLLEKKADINIFGALDKGMALMTPLGLATNDAQYDKNYEIVELLLNNGADANFSDREGRIPLHLAGENQFLIDLLLKKSDINSINKRNGKTLLMETAAYAFSSVEHIKLFLEKGADINLEDNEGETALYKAVKSRMNKTDEKFEVPQFLIENGADINHLNKNGLSILHIALINKWAYPALRFLLNSPINKRLLTGDNKTFLMLFAGIGQIGFLKQFTSAMDMINHQDNDGNTALHYALQNTEVSVELLEFLIKNKANPNLCNKHGQTPFLIGLISGVKDKKIIDLLINAGTDIDIRDENGKTALFYAIEETDQYLTALLLIEGADWKIEDSNGYSAYRTALTKLSEAEQADKDEDGWYELKIDSCRRIVYMFHNYGAGKEFEIR